MKFCIWLGLIFIFVLSASSQPVPDFFLTNRATFIYSHTKGTNGSYSTLGSGFFVQLTGAKATNTYLVTAKHVLTNEAGETRGFALMEEPKLNVGVSNVSRVVIFPPKYPAYVPTDVAIDLIAVKIDMSKHAHVVCGVFTESHFMTREQFALPHIRPGERMFYLGLQTNLSSIGPGYPFYRFGSLGMLPNIPMPFNGAMQWMVLMDARSNSGNSGSPAIFHFPDARKVGATNAHFALAGVVSAIVEGSLPIEIERIDDGGDEKAEKAEKGERTGFMFPMNMGITAIVPSWQLLELLQGVDKIPVIETPR